MHFCFNYKVNLGWLCELQISNVKYALLLTKCGNFPNMPTFDLREKKTGEIKPLKTKASKNGMMQFEYIIIILDKLWISAFAS